jgi:hypothetical protein
MLLNLRLHVFSNPTNYFQRVRITAEHREFLEPQVWHFAFRVPGAKRPVWKEMLAGLPDFLCHLAQLNVGKAHSAVAIRRATAKLANAAAWNKALRQFVDELVAMPFVKIG